jgi:hypothetical protein
MVHSSLSPRTPERLTLISGFLSLRSKLMDGLRLAPCSGVCHSQRYADGGHEVDRVFGVGGVQWRCGSVDFVVQVWA